MHNDTAATLQIEYDMTVYQYGPDSQQARDAEGAANEFFQRVSVAPVTPADQLKEVSRWDS